MKHIVFMMRNYYPYFSAVGMCLGNVANEISNNNKVTVICEKSKLEESDYEIFNNQHIIRVVSKNTKNRLKIASKICSENLWNRIFYRYIMFLLRAFGYIRAITSRTSLNNDLYRTFLKALEKIDDKIDIIVPSCMPFETIYAASIYKKQNGYVKVVPFLFDKFSENATLHRTQWNKKLKLSANVSLERHVFSSCDRILFTPSWDEHLQRHFSDMGFPLYPVEHPLIKNIEEDNLVTFDSSLINVVYTGTLMKKSRNPEYTLRLLESLTLAIPNIFFHFYTMGDAVNLVKTFTTDHIDNSKLYGQVQTNVAHSAAKHASILLSVGNTDITQTPSKIFEYMSCGKPIIHVAVFHTDPVIGILANYPYACCISQDSGDFEKHLLSIKEFIILNSDKSVSFAHIEKIFYNAIPQYSSEIILQS